MYRDPLDVLISIENGTCAGCKYQREEWDTRYCGLGKRYGWKCKSYEEVEVDNGKS
ncbi:hypothetical protein QZJ86_12140 [Methylomonas montana]|uniref:hypothetical protein n=1 Tax=Methylomonas montana TaxID=3058963 RepID=UPI00265A7A60|nr:hypothetical protein [Methylomonas montana]WKJ88772.1 hypothetical protein QZJ86_12140 [Methylomonas montana]